VVISPPYKWQLRYNSSDIEVKNRIDDPVDPKILSELSKKFGEFRRAYEPEGMKVPEFDSFGPTVRTIRQFSAGCADLASLIRDFMMPNPDQ
jgi:transaldolase